MELECPKKGCTGVIRYKDTACYAVCEKCGKRIKIESEDLKESKLFIPQNVSNKNVADKKKILLLIFGCIALLVCVAGISLYKDVLYEIEVENQLKKAEELAATEKYMEAIEIYSSVSNQSRYFDESQELIQKTKEEYKNSIIGKSSELLNSLQYEEAYYMVQQGKEDLGDLEELTTQENVVRESIISKVTPFVEIVFNGGEIVEGDELDPSLFSIKFDYLGLYKAEGSADKCEPQIVENVGETEIILSYKQDTYSWKTNVIPKVQKITAEYVGSEVTRGDTLKNSSIKVTGTCTDSSTREIKDFQLSKTVLEKYGENVITINYLDLSCECYVKAKPQKTGIQLSTKHSLYEKGKIIGNEEFNVVLLYEDGSQESVDVAACIFQGRSPSIVGKNTITASFDGFSDTTEVTGFEYVPLKNIEIISEYGAYWSGDNSSDIMGNVYEKPLYINVADMDANSYYAEWYVGGNYDIVEGMIATHKYASEKDRYLILIYADDILVYSSQECHKRVDPFKFSVHIENADYLKFETKLVGDNEWSDSDTDAILSELVLVKTK